MNKILVGLILGIVICMSIIFDFFDIVGSLNTLNTLKITLGIDKYSLFLGKR